MTDILWTAVLVYVIENRKSQESKYYYYVEIKNIVFIGQTDSIDG